MPARPIARRAGLERVRGKVGSIQSVSSGFWRVTVASSTKGNWDEKFFAWGRK